MSIARPDRAFFLIAAACMLAYVSLPRDTACKRFLYSRPVPAAEIDSMLVTAQVA